MWNKKNNTAKGKGAFEFDLSANRMSAFSAVKAQKSEPSNIAKGALGLCAFLTSAHNSTKNKSDVEFRDGHSGFGHYYNPLDLDLD
ncbi:hypothetical protein [Pasteurella multocida]|uniref:hypothetical protein n=1 Tax=Pasteurella multocida TaxID=747 RepID=UPI0030D0ED28